MYFLSYVVICHLLRGATREMMADAVTRHCLQLSSNLYYYRIFISDFNSFSKIIYNFFRVRWV